MIKNGRVPILKNPKRIPIKRKSIIVGKWGSSKFYGRVNENWLLP